MSPYHKCPIVSLFETIHSGNQAPYETLYAAREAARSGCMRKIVGYQE